SAVFLADDEPPHLRRAHVVHDVERDSIALEDLEVFPEGAPAAVFLRRDGGSFAGENGHYSLPQLALGAGAIGEQWDAGGAHHGERGGVAYFSIRGDGALGGAGGERSDGGDASVPDPDIGVIPGVARAIHHATAGENHVELLGVQSSSGQNGVQKKDG